MTCRIPHYDWDNGNHSIRDLHTNALFQEVSGVWNGKEMEGG